MKMGSIRDQAKFDRAQWQLKVLVPCWMTQISLFMILIGTCSYLLANSVKTSEEERGTAVVWECITIGVSALSIVCTAYEIFKTFSEALTPKEVMISNLVKLVGTILAMIMDGVMAGTGLWKWSIGTEVANGLAIASIIVLGSYAAWKWRRLAQYDDYHHPANVKPFGFKSDIKGNSLHSRHPSDEDWDVELSLANMSGEEPMVASPDRTPTTTTTRERGSSFVKVGGRLDYSASRDVNEVNEQTSHSRNNSASALISVDTSYEPQTTFAAAAITATTTTTITSTSTASSSPTPTATGTGPTSPPAREASRSPAPYISMTGTGTGRRASYNHTRDTSFDQYVQHRRTSQQQQQQQQQLHRSQDSGSSSGSGAGTPYSGSAGSRHSLGLIPLGPSSPPPTATARSRARSNTEREAAASQTPTQTPTPTQQQQQQKKKQQQQRFSLQNGTSNSDGKGKGLYQQIQRQSKQSLKDDVDDAMGAEFGWGTNSRGSSQDSVMAGGSPAGIAVTGGSVSGARNVRDSLGRAPSDGSESGVVLGPVPEKGGDGGEGDRFEAAGSEGDVRRRKDFDEASRALLGEGEQDGDGEDGVRVYPAAALRKLDGYGRPRGASETIEFVVTPPPRGSTEERRDVRKTWGAAYQRP